MEYTAALGATFSCISPIRSANIFLSSVCMIDSIGVPKILILYFSKTPDFSNSTPQLSAVCPPKVKSTPSGLSERITYK